jgi:LacI family transcriptional regulator
MDIKEIARAASVSIATVSRVLNDSKPVSRELRERVLAVIEREHYSPSHVARSMVLQRTGTMGLIMPEVSPMFHHHVFRSIEYALEKNGYRLIVAHVRDETDSELSYLDLLSQKKVDGIVLMQETRHDKVREWLARLTVPVVQCSVRIPGIEHAAVGVDEFQAAYDGTAFLLELGHRRIGYIGGHGHEAGEKRLRGHKAALYACGVEPDPRLTEQGMYSFEEGRQALRRLLATGLEPTAIFTASDEMAIGAIRAASESGLIVPDDLSVLGFDGIELGEFVRPALSTVYQPLSDIGTTSVELLLEQMSLGAEARRAVILPHQVLERESTAHV